MKLKIKINLTKGPKQKKIKRKRTKLKNITYHKLRLNDEIEKNIKILQKDQEQKIEIERLRTKSYILILNQKTTLQFCMPDMIFELMKEKSRRKKKGHWAHIATLTPPRTVSKGRDAT